ncbi:hypothetical protein BJX63DRAFT_382316 [Aspergillus granulosus]|uniref:LysM domain-containing protein n=1 Tax=Aspergillus granulosus TaxID=176169 RepID=A0ABR4HVK0_9EURO
MGYPGNTMSEYNSYTTAVAGATATTPAPIPSNVVAGTNVNCGKYYHVKDGDYCQLIAMVNGISVSDFLFLNPEVDSNCTNLYKDYSYCVQPVGKIENYPGATCLLPRALHPGSQLSHQALHRRLQRSVAKLRILRRRRLHDQQDQHDRDNDDDHHIGTNLCFCGTSWAYTVEHPMCMQQVHHAGGW